eukprot:3752786-Pleurochrysis_carterae.AAC.1
MSRLAARHRRLWPAKRPRPLPTTTCSCSRWQARARVRCGAAHRFDAPSGYCHAGWRARRGGRHDTIRSRGRRQRGCG